MTLKFSKGNFLVIKGISDIVQKERFVILQISPLNLFVNSLLPFSLHLLLSSFATYTQKGECSDFNKNSKTKEKKIRGLNFSFFFFQSASYCNQAISCKENLTTWKLGPITHLSQLAIRKLKVSFVTHFYELSQLNSHHLSFLLFYPYEILSISVCF